MGASSQGNGWYKIVFKSHHPILPTKDIPDHAYPRRTNQTPYSKKQLAKEKASQLNLRVDGITKDISRVTFPEKQFDVIWFSGAMYSCVPSRKRRQAMLNNMYTALADDGVLVCQFHMDARQHTHSTLQRLSRFISSFLLFNWSYETGDMLWGRSEFLHAFKDEEDLSQELSRAGFKKQFFTLYSGGVRGGSIWSKGGKE